MSWAYVASLFLVIHVATGLIFPDQIWTTPVGAGSICLLAAAFCARRAHLAIIGKRLRWVAMLVVFLLWVAAYVAILQLQLSGDDTTNVHLFSLLFMLRGVPLLLLLSQSGLDEGWVIKAADGMQAMLFAALLIILLLPAFWPENTSGEVVTSLTALEYHDVQNFGLAALSLLNLGRRKPAEQRQFDRAVAMLLAMYAAISWLVNHLSITATPSPPPGSPINALGDIPMLIFFFAFTGKRSELAPLRDNLPRLLLSLALPAGFCGASVLIAMVILPQHQSVAMGGAVAAIALFALRGAISQANLLKARHDPFRGS